jgi:signal transduction histidine kinase
LLYVLLATIVKLVLWPWLGEEAPESLYLVAITVAAARGGVAGAASANVGAFVLGAILFARPYGSLLIEQPRTAMHLLAQAVEGLVISAIVIHLVRTRARARANLERHGELARRELRLAGLAHDVGNLLGVIVPCIDIARRAVPHEATSANAALADAQLAAFRVSRLTRRMVSVARDAQEPQGHVDVDHLLDELASILGRIAGARIRVTVSRYGSPLWVKGDAAELEQAILNLVVNGCQAMPEGGQLRVSLERERRGAGVGIALSVSDTGGGMSAHAQRRAFEPLFTTKPGGSGIGLAVVADVARRHSGDVHIEHTDRHGTTVVISLPENAPA